MVDLLIRLERGGLGGLSFLTLAFALIPVSIGPQDLVSLFARRALAAEFNPAPPISPFSGIHVPVYTFPRPIGAEIPRPAAYRLASLESYAPGVTRSNMFSHPVRVSNGDTASPEVNRGSKANRLKPARGPVHDAAKAKTPAPAGTRASAQGAARSILAPPRIEAAPPAEERIWRAAKDRATRTGPTSPIQTVSLYFGADSLNAPQAAFEWAPSVEPSVPLPPERQPELGGETIAGKGEVTGKDKTPRSLAARLGLTKKQRAKAEKCLADAVYFEARGEPVRGQIAVAQVVMNRVFSPFYPDEVCEVVYQNADRRFGCQFTFACDGIPEVVTEPEAWKRAKEIAKDTLDGKLWLPEIGKATHYHAYWVHPSWVHEMRKLYKLGVHTFYRPRAWGSGADEPAWGSAKITAELVKKL